MIRPLQDKLIVKPTPPEQETAAGIVIPGTARVDPAMSGHVVSVGRGPDSARRVRGATIAACMRIVDEVAEHVPASVLRPKLLDAFMEYQLASTTTSGIHEGDVVCFPYTAGAKMQVDGDEYIVLREDDVVAVLEADE